MTNFIGTHTFFGAPQQRAKVDESVSTDPATVSDPSRPEYDKNSPHYDPRLDRTSELFGQDLSFTPHTGGHTSNKPGSRGLARVTRRTGR